jgi:alpha-galactosidase
VWIKFFDRHGPLTVGYGSPGCIGPELGFGTVVGDYCKSRGEGPVLILKIAWGGRSLYQDFRPPSAGLPDDAVLQKILANRQKRKPATTMDDVKSSFGASYRAMIQEETSALANLKTLFPQYDGQGYELDGFVWFQGWNDMIDKTATNEYASNMERFIRDVRKDLKSPELPFVIGQMGVGGVDTADANVKRFKAAQAAVMDVPDFKNNVALVKTDAFWDTQADAVFKKGWRQHEAEWKTVGSNYGYHYYGSARTMLAIGRAFGDAMLKLRGDIK